MAEFSARRMAVLGGVPEGKRLARMLASPRNIDGRFVNTSPAARKMPGPDFGTLRDFVAGGEARVPPAPLPMVSPLEAWATTPSSDVHVTWLGHSTMLLEIDGATLLTDPVWGARASPLPFAGPKRFHAPPARLDQLPKIDAVVISHDHYDHLDHPTLLQLAKTTLPIITSLGVGAHLEAWGISPDRITELDWWEEARIPGTQVKVTATPAQHFSGRGVGDRNVTSWSSLVIEGPDHRLFFSGDTGLTEEFVEIGKRKGPFDLVMIEIGAWHPSWGTIHLGPENALKANAMLGGGRFMPVHWGTFNLAIHAWNEPAETLAELAFAQHVKLVTPRIGGSVEPLRDPAFDPWWREVGLAEALDEPSSEADSEPAPAPATR